MRTDHRPYITLHFDDGTGGKLDEVFCFGDTETNELKYLRDTLYVMGGKWKLPIMHALGQGNLRFNQIKKYIPGITSRTLTRELRELEMNKIIIRKPHPEGFVGMEYEVTDYCRSFDPVISSMIEWGKRHRRVI